MALKNPFVRREEQEESENQEIITPVKKAKVSPLVIDNVMVLTSEQRTRIKELIKSISTAAEKVQQLVISTSEKYYALGEILFEAISRMPGSRATTTAELEKITGTPARMITTALKIYKHFGNYPEALKDLSLREAVALISEKSQSGKKEFIEYNLPAGQLEFDEDFFALPTASGVRLSLYRLRVDKEQFYLIKKGFNVPVKVANLSISEPQDAETQAAFQRMNKEIQIAMEKYYAVVEESEVQD